MRIALVTEPLAAGVGRYVSELAKGLAGRGHDVVLIYSPIRTESAYLDRLVNDPKITLAPVPLHRRVSHRDWAGLVALVRVLLTHGPFDVVHAHSSKAGTLVRLALFCSKAVVYSPHAMITLNPSLGKAARLAYGAIELILGRFSFGRVIACSDEEARSVTDLGIPPSKIVTVVNSAAIDPVACDRGMRTKLGLAPDDFCVGFVGRFSDQKRPRDFVRVIQALRSKGSPVKAVMVGSGDEEGRLRSMIHEENLSEVIGLVRSHDARQEIGAFDVLCITSAYEGFSICLIEALALGVPIVSTTVGGARQALRGDECGSVVSRFDPESFAERILHLRRQDPQRTAAACFERYLNEFSTTRMLEELEHVYRSAPRRSSGLKRLREALPSLLAPLVIAAALCCSLADPAMAVGSVSLAPGAVVEPGRAVTVDVKSDAPAVTWRLRDVHDAAVNAGTAATKDQRARIAVPLRGAGYFELELSDEKSSVRVALAGVPSHGRPSARFGVMTHFAQGWDVDIVPLIRQLGVGQVRDELYWAEIERSPGQYISPPAYDRYMGALRQNDIDPLIILSFANPLYDGGKTPYSDEGRAAFARYALNLLRLYGNQIKRVEVWNEYNGSFCTGPCESDRPKFYALMLKEVFNAVKSERPDVTVVGASTVLVPIPYFEKLIAHGALESMDAVSIHPYGGSPEQIGSKISALRDLMIQKVGHAKPIWVTEIGQIGERGDRRAALARYLIKSLTVVLASGAEPIYWYLLRDYAQFDGMGLIRDAQDPLGRYGPTPAFAAYATLIRQLDRARYRQRLPTDPRTQLHAFERDGLSVMVAWATDSGSTLVFGTGHPMMRIGFVGDVTQLKPEQGVIKVAVGNEPVFLVGDASLLKEERSDELIADSEVDFELQQGRHNWTYLARSDSSESLHRGPSSVAELSLRQDAWATKWALDGDAFLSVGPSDMHPSVRDREAVSAVRRWTSPTARHVTIRGRAVRPSADGDGSGLRVRIDDDLVLDQVIDPKKEPRELDFSFDADLKRGSTVEFEVTPGPGDDVNFDVVLLNVAVTGKKP